MPAARVSAGVPWEPSASQLGWGLIRHHAGESPPADLPETPTTRCCQPRLCSQDRLYVLPNIPYSREVFSHLGSVCGCSVCTQLLLVVRSKTLTEAMPARIPVLGLRAKAVRTQNDLCPIPRGTAGGSQSQLISGVHILCHMGCLKAA